MENQEVYESARKKVEAKLRFRIHLWVFIGVMTLLFLINIVNTPEYLWFKWPLFGWGFAVVMHALRVFVFPEKLTITEGMITKQMEKDAAKNL